MFFEKNSVVLRMVYTVDVDGSKIVTANDSNSESVNAEDRARSEPGGTR